MAPGSCADGVARVPGAREAQVSDLLREIGEARRRHRALLVVLDCLGGYSGGALDVWASLDGARRAGFGVVAHVTRALSAALYPVLAASYVVVAPGGCFGLHQGEVAPDGLPVAARPSAAGQVLATAEARAAGDTIQTLAAKLLLTQTLATPDQVAGWWASPELTTISPAEAVDLALADAVGSLTRALAVAHALARGDERVVSPRRRALEAAGRGDAAAGRRR
jgi:hypothetical protein